MIGGRKDEEKKRGSHSSMQIRRRQAKDDYDNPIQSSEISLCLFQKGIISPSICCVWISLSFSIISMDHHHRFVSWLGATRIFFIFLDGPLLHTYTHIWSGFQVAVVDLLLTQNFEERAHVNLALHWLTHYVRIMMMMMTIRWISLIQMMITLLYLINGSRSPKKFDHEKIEPRRGEIFKW